MSESDTPPPFEGSAYDQRPAPVFHFNEAPTLPGGVPTGGMPVTATAAPPPPPPPHQGGRLARRALLTAGGLGLCAAGAALAVPVAVRTTEQAATHQAETAAAQAAAKARADLIAELKALETDAGIVGLDAAIGAAGATLWATQHIFVPLANLIATIGGDALGTLVTLLGQASGVLGFLRVDVTPLNDLSTTIQTWQAALKQLPAGLQQGATQDISGASLYLIALQKKLESEQATPTTTSGA